MDPQPQSIEAIQELIVSELEAHGTIKDSRNLILPGEKEHAVSQSAQAKILGALNSLASREVRNLRLSRFIQIFNDQQMVTYEIHDILSHVLTDEGKQIALEGSHEARVWNALPLKDQGTPVTIKQLQEKVGSETAKIGQGNAFKNGWIGKDGDGFVKKVKCFVKFRCFHSLQAVYDYH